MGSLLHDSVRVSARMLGARIPGARIRRFSARILFFAWCANPFFWCANPLFLVRESVSMVRESDGLVRESVRFGARESCVSHSARIRFFGARIRFFGARIHFQPIKIAALMEDQLKLFDNQTGSSSGRCWSWDMSGRLGIRC